MAYFNLLGIAHWDYGYRVRLFESRAGPLWLGFLLLLIIALLGRFKDSKSDSAEDSEL